MKQVFYKDIKLIKFCKVCGVEYRPQRFTFFAALRLCHKHRGEFYKRIYHEWFLPWIAKQSSEVQQRYKDMRYGVWKKWIVKHADRRRMQALASYHLNKDKHRSRKHRATKIKIPA